MNRKLIKDLMDAIKASDRKKTSGYDTSAVVRRIEDGTAWVHIPGGVDETPVKLTINASVGDTVQVRVSGGRAFLVGNRTAPPTDDTTAIKATYVAKNAQETAVEAKSEASEAWHYAGTAKEAAESAQDSADSAAEAAIEAWNHADDAHQAAVSANNSANNALVQLSVVEDVAGTLRWISEHGSYVLTTDTTVTEGSVYFIYENGDYIPIANPDPSANPSQEGWYVLDVTESQAKYIMAHLAVTSAGLWVLPVNQLAEHPLVDSNDNQIIDSDNNPIVDFSEDPQYSSGYKVLLSGGTNDPNFPIGLSIYNDEGAMVANYGKTTTIGNALLKHVYIDTDSVDIKDGDSVLASFEENGMRVYAGGTEVVNIGKRVDAVTGGQYGRLVVKETDALGNETGEQALLLNDSVSFFDTVNEKISVVYGADGILVGDSNGVVRNEPVGKTYAGVNTSSNVSVENNNWTLVDSLSLYAGTYLVLFGGGFNSNANGSRLFKLNTNSSPSGTAPGRGDVQMRAVDGFATSITAPRLVVLATQTTLYLHAYQNSGQTITVYPNLKAVKLW